MCDVVDFGWVLFILYMNIMFILGKMQVVLMLWTHFGISFFFLVISSLEFDVFSQCFFKCFVLHQLSFIFCSFFRRAEWLRILNVKSLVKSLYACSIHFAPEFIYGNRISKFAVPKCAQLNALFRERTVPNFYKDSEIKVGNQGDKILEDVTMDSEIPFTFGETQSHWNSDVRTLKATLDHYRGQYLLEKRLKTKLKVANARLSREVEKYKSKVQNLKLEFKQKNDFSSKISKLLLVCLENGLTNYAREPKQRRYSVGLKLISLAVLSV